MKGRDIMFQLRKCSAGAKGVFIERRPRSKYAEKQVGKSTGCGEKPLSSYVTPHSLATRMRHSSDAGIGTKNRGKRILGRLECLPPLGLPPDSYFHTAAQRTWPLTPLATTLQCSCCETSFKLRPDRPLQPVPHAVPCGSRG